MLNAVPASREIGWIALTREWMGTVAPSPDVLHEDSGVLIFRTGGDVFVLTHDRDEFADARATTVLEDAEPAIYFGYALAVDELEDTMVWVYPES